MEEIAHRLAPLIAERAPWLAAPGPLTRLARMGLDAALRYRRTVALARMVDPLPAPAIMAALGHMIARDVRCTDLHRVPQTGPFLVVANHPTGIADGVILHSAIAPRRPDLVFLANADILRVLPQLDTLIAPVEWRPDQRSHSKTRHTMAALRTALGAGRPCVIFPAGRLAKRHGLKLHERPWMRSAAMIARKFDLPVVPIHIAARNSTLFYLFDALHPTLRDITLFHETLNKARQPYRLRVGLPVAPGDLPADPDQAIAFLRARTLSLAGRDAPALSRGRVPRTIRSLGRT